MQDSTKYLIHADIRASGVVERSDVVGAIFGQTEGLLGEDLDLRDLQESSKVGRIDVDIHSEAGRSYGTVTIASGLDRVETAVLAASLETIDRIGPCRAEFDVTDLEDVRAAKRRAVIERATELLEAFEESALSSHELVEEVRRNVRVADITEFEGLPAGPRVAESDAIVVVEGRADVLQVLKYGIKNAIAVEGTDIPDAVAELTRERTVTAFLDGDRGGDLILEELAQVGSIDYVAFAPAGQSVEDLSRKTALSALRNKVSFDEVEDAGSPRAVVLGEPTAEGSVATANSTADEDADAGGSTDDGRMDADAGGSTDDGRVDVDGGTVTQRVESVVESASTRPEAQSDSSDVVEDEDPPPDDTETESEAEADPESPTRPQTLAGHVEEVVTAESGQSRLLDETFEVLWEGDVTDVFEAIEAAKHSPHAVVLDGELSQRVLDVAAQRGVGQIVARSEGEFVKRPTSVRVRTVEEF